MGAVDSGKRGCPGGTGPNLQGLVQRLREQELGLPRRQQLATAHGDPRDPHGAGDRLGACASPEPHGQCRSRSRVALGISQQMPPLELEAIKLWESRT
jgi:hypothetical protein